MNARLIWCVLVVAAFVQIIAQNHINSGDRIVRACGKYLSRILHDMCQGKYNKRTLLDLNSDDYDYDGSTEGTSSVILSEYSLKNKADVYDMLIPSRFRKNEIRGIVEECCLQSCRLSELTSYCGF